MNPEPRFQRRLGRVLAFFLSCGATCALMLLLREWEFVFTLPFALGTLITGGVLAWFVLRRWRFAAPLRCAVELGIGGGIGGLGLHILFFYAIISLLTPRGGLMSSP